VSDRGSLAGGPDATIEWSIAQEWPVTLNYPKMRLIELQPLPPWSMSISSAVAGSSVRRICFGLMVCLCQIGCSHKTQYYVDRGDLLYAKGQYSEAALNYRKGIAKTANSAEAHEGLGLTELKLGNRRTAYEELRRALELAPNREDMRVELANMVLESYSADPRRPKFLYDQLTESAQYLLRGNPNSFEGLRLQGDIYMLDGRLEEAVATFRRARAIRPFEPQLVSPMLQVLFRLNQAAEAEGLTQEFLRNRKDFGPVYDVLLNHYIQVGRMPEAEALLKSKVANMPLDPRPVLQLASLYLTLHRESAVAQTLQEILSKPRNFPEGHQIVGDFYASKDRLDQALREYTEGLRANPKDAVHYRKRLVKVMIAKGKREDAIAELNTIIKSNADDLDARLARAILLRESADPKRLEFAGAELNAVLAKNPNDEVARFNLGLVYAAKGNPDAAHAQLIESASLNRNYLLPRLALAEMAQKARNYNEVIRVADEVLAVDAENLDARLWRATGMIGNKAFLQARGDLNSLLKQKPDSLNVNLLVAVLDTDEKKYQAAETRYLRLYKPRQKDLRPLEGLIQLYSEEKHIDKALKLLDEELRQAPESQPLHLLLAATAAQAGKVDLAIQQYEWLRANGSTSPQTYTSLGNIYQLKGDVNNAMASYQKAQELVPNDPKIIAMIAYLQSTSGKEAEAIAGFQKQLAINPQDTTAMNNLAFVLADTETDLDRAQTLALEAQRRAPNNSGIVDTLAWVYVKKGLNDSAIQIYNGLVRKYPNEPVLRYHLGVALLQKGQAEEAKSEFVIGLSKNPPKDMADKIKQILSKLG
jgi:tetratricopeptide (TPR) repeat protein